MDKAGAIHLNDDHKVRTTQYLPQAHDFINRNFSISEMGCCHLRPLFHSVRTRSRHPLDQAEKQYRPSSTELHTCRTGSAHHRLGPLSSSHWLQG